jgi:hypothetical protein
VPPTWDQRVNGLTSVQRKPCKNRNVGAREGRFLLTPEERSLRARIAAYSLHAQRDPRETTAKGRAAFLSRFERDVDPEGKLPPEERSRRAECARKAHMAKLALRSARARSSPKHKHKSESPPIEAASAVEV